MVAGFHSLVDFADGFAFFDRFAFVVQFLGFGEGELYFGSASFEINFEGDQVVAFFLGLADQFGDFTLVEEQFPFSHGVVAELAGGRVGIDMKIVEPNFSPLDRGITIHQVGFAFAQGFHLGSAQDHSRLDRVFDEVIVPRLFVLADDLDAVHDLI